FRKPARAVPQRRRDRRCGGEGAGEVAAPGAAARSGSVRRRRDGRGRGGAVPVVSGFTLAGSVEQRPVGRRGGECGVPCELAVAGAADAVPSALERQGTRQIAETLGPRVEFATQDEWR